MLFNKKTKLSTDSYKGVRDFYPEDMAVQRYIFNVWSETAESFGFERYDASILEPTDLYQSKSSDEIVNEQTYTFTDRGDRRVTLRPEMTPTVARMIAGQRRELTFPLRWYSIPNLFRYERPQRGRLREHWQLNCDLFGVDDNSADVEVIALASQTLINFGADEGMFEIRINDRAWLNEIFEEKGFTKEQSAEMLALLDRKEKINDFQAQAAKIAGGPFELPTEAPEGSAIKKVINGLRDLGINNVTFSPSTVRGFTYYTGIVFEFFDTAEGNNRSILGGGRYDNLVEMFGGDKISGIGFGMGDVTMRDFLETHNLLTSDITSPTLMIIPTDEAHNIEAQRIAQSFRAAGISVSVDMSGKKIGQKIGDAADVFVSYVLVLGDDEVAKATYALKNLETKEETAGTLTELLSTFSA